MLRPKLLTALCYGAMMSLAIGLNLLPVFLTSIGMSLGGEEGLTREELGRLGAVAFAGLVVGILGTGPLADRCGAKIFAVFGNVLTIAGLIGMAWAPTYGILLGMMFVIGLGAGMLDMILSPVVAALNPERRSAAMNWLHSFYCVGAVVTILIGTVALTMGMGWRSVCLVVLPLPAGLLFAFLPMHFPPLVTDRVRLPMGTLMLKLWFVGALLAIFLGGATELGMAQWLPAYAETSLGFSTSIGGVALLLFSVAMTLGRMVAGMLGERINPYLLLSVVAGSLMENFLLGAFLPQPGWALAACVAAGFTGSCLWPTLLGVAADRYPDGGASMFGALAAMGNAGGIFMPWIVGFVGDAFDLHWGLATSALAPFLMLPLLFFLWRGAKKAGGASLPTPDRGEA